MFHMMLGRTGRRKGPRNNKENRARPLSSPSPAASTNSSDGDDEENDEEENDDSGDAGDEDGASGEEEENSDGSYDEPSDDHRTPAALRGRRTRQSARNKMRRLTYDETDNSDPVTAHSDTEENASTTATAAVAANTTNQSASADEKKKSDTMDRKHSAVTPDATMAPVTAASAVPSESREESTGVVEDQKSAQWIRAREEKNREKAALVKSGRFNPASGPPNESNFISDHDRARDRDADGDTKMRSDSSENVAASVEASVEEPEIKATAQRPRRRRVIQETDESHDTTEENTPPPPPSASASTTSTY